MKKMKWTKLLALCLAVLLIGTAAADTFVYDQNGDKKTNVWDLQVAVNEGAGAADQAAILDEILGGGDELHKNENDQWEIWSSVGLYNMAKHAQDGDTFVLMQDIDMNGAPWTPVENFKGTFVGNANYSVSNMKITKSVDGNMGFFGSIAAGSRVEYLNLKDLNVIADANATSIGLLAGSCAGTIDGCTTIGFVTDERTTLPGDVLVGGMAGKMLSDGLIISRDINKLPEEGAEQSINKISAQIGTRFAAESGHIVGIVGEGVDKVDSGTVLQKLTGMPDPNAIAWVTNGDVTTYPLTLTDLLAGINADGNTVVTLQSDISNTAAVKIPYTCTFDCNGYTIRTPENKNNGVQIVAAGTANQTFTLMNGKLFHYEIGVCASAGAVVLSNMTIIANGGAPVGLYDTTDYSAINRIENCTLVSKNWGCVVFNGVDKDMTNTGITIENSNLISGKPAGNALLIKNMASKAGTVTLGNNVEFYTYGSTYFGSAVTVTGVDPVKLEDKATVQVEGLTYEGLNHWTTDETRISKDVIAEVTNGSDMVQVTNTTDMVNLLEADGTTQVKLVKDLVRTTPLTIPYSCTIDMNGHSITSASSNCITLDGVGTSNTVTTIMNGTLNHGIIGVRINAGSVNLSNMNINGVGNCAASVGFYDPSAAYKAGNMIDGCTIYNPNYINIMFYGKDVEFKDTGVAIENTTLIAEKSYPFGVTTEKKSGIVDLGAGVEIYSPKTAVAGSSLYRFLGLVAYRTEQNSVTVNGTQITGMNHWSTDNQKDIVDILLIGNSYSTTIPQELYNIATNAGHEVNVANIYFPGCIAAEHWDWLNNNVANYQYRHQSQMGNYIRRGDMSTSKYALEDEDWDVIVYQDWFTPKNVVRDSGYVCDSSTLELLYANHQEHAYKMMQYLKTNYPNAKHYYYQHWSWQVGHSSIPDIAAANAMWDRINTASTKFAEENDFILIPCGLAFQLARADESIGETLWDTDKSHDGGPGGGQYLNGCVFFETIFQESCIGDTWRASNGPSEEKHVLLQQYAHEAVATVHGEDWITE